MPALIAALSREQRKSMLDPLTQLWNRAGLNHFLAKQLLQAEEQGLQLGVLFCDLDHFKPVNDTHGHAAGDQALWETARRISASVRPQDVVTRSGGEEVVVLLLVHDQQELLRMGLVVICFRPSLGGGASHRRGSRCRES